MLLDRYYLSALGFALALSGCAGGNSYVTKEDMEDPDVSLVYGFIGMADAESTFSRLEVEQVLPRTDDPIWPFTVRKGVFFHEALPLGSYRLSSFSGRNSILMGAHDSHYTFPPQTKGKRIKQPGLHFWGAFDCHVVDEGFKLKSLFIVEEGGFYLEETDSPSELDVLNFILPKLEGTKWEKPVSERIRSLSR